MCGDLSLHKIGTWISSHRAEPLWNRVLVLILQTLDRIALVMNDYPLLWVVYGFTVLLPVVGAIACCFWPKVRGRSAVTNNIHNIDMNIHFWNLNCVALSPRQNPLWLLIMNLIFDICCLPPYPALVGKNSRYAHIGCHCASLICNFPFVQRNVHGIYSLQELCDVV